MKFNVSQNSMVFGEITPSLYGQRNIDQYRGGLKTVKNFIVRPQGGVTRREGTEWQVDLPQDDGASAITDQHTYRCVPYTFTDFLGVARQIIFIFQHGFVTAWEEDSSGKLGPARFQRYDPNFEGNIHPQNEPLWFNTSFFTPPAADGIAWHELNSTGPRIIPTSDDFVTAGMIGFQYPDLGQGSDSIPEGSWQYGAIDTIPFGHGSGPFYVATPADLGNMQDGNPVVAATHHISTAADWNLQVPDEDNPGSTTVGRGPFWLVVTGGAPDHQESRLIKIDEGSTTQSTNIAAASTHITESRSPCYLGLSNQPINPAQIGRYPGPINSPFTFARIAHTSLPVNNHQDWRIALLPWNKIGRLDNSDADLGNKQVCEEGQWFRDFRRSEVSASDEVSIQSPEYGSASWLQNLRYQQDNNTLWVTLSPTVVARFEYRAWDSQYGLSQGPKLPGDSGNRVVNDITMSLHQLGVAGPFRYDTADTITISAASVEALETQGSIISMSTIVDHDGQNPVNDNNRLGDPGTTGVNVLGAGGLDNVNFMEMDPASDVDISGHSHDSSTNKQLKLSYLGGYNSAIGPGMVHNLQLVWNSEWNPLKLTEDNDSTPTGLAGYGVLGIQNRQPGIWSEATSALESVTGFRVQLGNSTGKSVETGFDGLITPARAGTLFTGLASTEINDPHAFAFDSAGNPSTNGWSDVPIQMTVTTAIDTHTNMSGMTEDTNNPWFVANDGSVPPATTEGPVEWHGEAWCNPNDYSATWGSSVGIQSDPTLTTSGGAAEVGGKWVDVGNIDIEEYIEPINDFEETLETNDGKRWQISSFKYYEFTVSDAFNTGATTIPPGTKYRLYWRIKPTGTYPIPYWYAANSTQPGIGWNGSWINSVYAPPYIIDGVNYNQLASHMDWVPKVEHFRSGIPWDYVYAGPQARPYLTTTEINAGGYGGILLASSNKDDWGGDSPPSDITNPFDSSAGSTRRGLNWMHHAWDPNRDPHERSAMILRPFLENASTTPAEPGAAEYGAWGSLFGRAFEPSTLTSLQMLRFQDRLVVSGGLDPRIAFFSSIDSLNEPNWLPFTNTGQTGDDVASSVAFRLQVDSLNSHITNMFSIESDLFIAEAGRLWKVVSPTIGTPISSANFYVQPISEYGANNVQVVLSEDTAIYVSADGRRLNRLTFGGSDEGYTLDSPSIYCDHLFEIGVVRMSSQPDPASILWALLSDGSLRTLTLNRRQLVQGGAQHTLGANSGGASILDMMTYYNAKGEWVNACLVKRKTYNDVGSEDTALLNTTSISLETFPQDFKVNPNTHEWTYLDKSKRISMPRSQNIPAGSFSHLKSDTVTLVADGVSYPNVSVDADGGISTLPWTSSATITGASQTNPVVITAADHGFLEGQHIRITGVVGMTELNNTTYEVGSVTKDTFSLKDVDGSTVTLAASWTSGNGTVTLTSGGASTMPGGGSGKSIRGGDMYAGAKVIVIYSDTSIQVHNTPTGTGSGDLTIGFNTYISGGTVSTHVFDLIAGFPYESKIETLPQDISLPSAGATDMSLRRTTEVVAKVESSAGGKAGSLGTTGSDLLYPSGASGVSHDADVSIVIDSDDDTDGSVFISTDSGQRLDITQIVTRTDYKSRGQN